MIAALVAAAVVVFGYAMGWHGVDTAAQVYRVDSFRAEGFTLWDFSWYGGHWTIDYSLLYPALAGTLGILAVTVLSAAASAYSFDRLVRHRLGPAGPATAYVFAVGTLVAASIGQLTFLAGEGFGLPAMLAVSKGRYRTAAVLGLACTLTSPLTGAFVAMATTAWGIDRLMAGDRRRVAVAVGLTAAAVLPILAAAVLFPGDGPMPYPAIDWVWEMIVAATIAVLAGRRHRTITVGCGLWMVAASFAEVVPSALGGNVGRLEDMVALPLGVALAWERMPLILPVAAVAMTLSQWMPAMGAFTTAPAQPSTRESFFAPLDRTLVGLEGKDPAGRVEIVPTEYHWEAAYVADVVPLARGWERQLDEADNPIFYGPGRLTSASYRGWLLDNGVRYVALAAAPLDMAGEAEAKLLDTGTVPGLRLVWSSPEWRVWAVAGSPGIVSGPATLVSENDGRVVLHAYSPGRVTVRIRWNKDWYVAAGAGCDEAVGDWTLVEVDRSGPVDLDMSLLQPNRTACPAEVTPPGPLAGGAAATGPLR